jgi:hypothetical protein
MQHDTEKIDQAVLALLWLTLHERDEFGGRSWKSHDWDVMDRLHKKGWISNPATRAKSVSLTPEAIAEAERLFHELFGAP